MVPPWGSPAAHGAVPGRVVVLGGGVVGAACAWRLAGRGHRVVLVDPVPGGGASRAAAGMLAPVSELHHGERELLELGLLAAAGFPRYVADVERGGGGGPPPHPPRRPLLVALASPVPPPHPHH
ncbi:FAD-dependent oxidoreductase, partial [Kineococcus esterisolvens]|uniref:FAD-dependent oxidoreductase n=1 Tax=Kineococcus sp. SYSU DK008 TaxID=3383129 RepID=UPI003D7D8BA2